MYSVLNVFIFASFSFKTPVSGRTYPAVCYSSHHFRSMLCSLSAFIQTRACQPKADKMQPVAAQDAFVRVCAQERLHQREAGQQAELPLALLHRRVD